MKLYKIKCRSEEEYYENIRILVSHGYLIGDKRFSTVEEVKADNGDMWHPVLTIGANYNNRIDGLGCKRVIYRSVFVEEDKRTISVEKAVELIKNGFCDA